MRDRITRFILARIGYRIKDIQVRDHHHNGLRTITVDLGHGNRLRANLPEEN